MRRILVFLALVTAAALVVIGFLVVPRELGEGNDPVVLPQSPMPGRLLVGFQDDASLRLDQKVEPLQS